MMGDWTTFKINIPATAEEVARIESSLLWATTRPHKSRLHEMAVYLGANPAHAPEGDSGTQLTYESGEITGQITINGGRASHAYEFLRGLELVLLRPVEEVHLAALYGVWGPEREIVHWRCQCDLPCEDLGDWREALVGVRLKHPTMSEKDLRAFARKFQTEDRRCKVIDNLVVIDFDHLGAEDTRRFRLGGWKVVSSGSLIHKTPIGWTSSGWAANQRVGQLLNC